VVHCGVNAISRNRCRAALLRTETPLKMGRGSWWTARSLNKRSELSSKWSRGPVPNWTDEYAFSEASERLVKVLMTSLALKS
jgi:hypothetical protein